MIESVDEHLTRRLQHWDVADAHTAPDPRVSDDDLLALFEAQTQARHLDLAGRWLQSQGQGFYTIGSAGHESNAAVAMVLRPTDPALLHYRSGGFFAARAAQVPGSSPVTDVLSGMAASAADPISGGRHKVFGHPDYAIIPQTSTIGSHLPRAVGLAFALGRAHAQELPTPWPDGRRRGLQLRRRVCQPLDLGRCPELGQLVRTPGSAARPALRLRGQRHRHLHQVTERLDRTFDVEPACHRVRLRRRQ